MVKVPVSLIVTCCVLMAGVCTSSYAMYDKRGDGMGVKVTVSGSQYVENVCDSHECATTGAVAYLNRRISSLEQEIEKLAKQQGEPGICDSGVIWGIKNLGKVSAGAGAALTAWGIARNHPWAGEALGAEVMAFGALAGDRHPALVAALACYGAGIPLADASYVLAKGGVISEERAEWFADHHRFAASCLSVAGALTTWAWRGLAKRGTRR